MSSTVRLGSTAWEPWWLKRSRCMRDRRASNRTTSSISAMEVYWSDQGVWEMYFFFLRWIVSVCRRLCSNYWIVKVCCQTCGISTGKGLLEASSGMEDCSPSGHLGRWAPLFTHLPIRGWGEGVMRIPKLPKYRDLWPRVGPNSQRISSNKWYQPYLIRLKWRRMKAQRHYQESWLLLKAQTNLKAHIKYFYIFFVILIK